MRLAVFSDIHGNPIALEAVLADIKAKGGADQCWILGDLAVGGYDPSGTLQRLSELPNARFVRGNTEADMAAGEPGPSLDELRTLPDTAQMAAQLTIAVMFAWSHGHLKAGGWLPWIAQLPLEERLTLPGGLRLTASHAAPGKDGSAATGRTVITPNMSDDEVRPLLAGCNADITLIGHTHYPMDRIVESVPSVTDPTKATGTVSGRDAASATNTHTVRLINCGSVSNPWAPDLRARYVLIDSGASGPHDLQVQHHRVEYDITAVIDALRTSGHPTAAWLAEHFQGKRQPPWLSDLSRRPRRLR